jgi:ABC-type amino acid transport substrate-binding protein
MNNTTERRRGSRAGNVLDRRTWLAGTAALCATAAMPAAAQALDKIRQRGRITVAVYQDMPPFHVGGKGIDVDIARALAKAMGLELSLMPFTADETMNGDLRSMVWRGHYLGFGPADVMLHVPVDPPLMQANPRVKIFAPYFRERVAIARDLTAVPQMPSLEAFADKRIAVPGQTLAGCRYREQLLTSWRDGTEAAAALRRGEVAAAAGMASELESVLAGDPRFAIESLPVPRMRDGWAIGCAVKEESADLAVAVQTAMNGLAASGELKTIFAASKVTWRPA